MPHADKDYSIVVMFFTMVLMGEQNQLTLIKSKILTSALTVLWKLKLTQDDKAIHNLLQTSPIFSSV